MPKLDGTHILERLTKRIEQLEAGDEIADKEIRSLLNDAQRAELDGAWAFGTVSAGVINDAKARVNSAYDAAIANLP